jgi:hypothetical protein
MVKRLQTQERGPPWRQQNFFLLKIIFKVKINIFMISDQRKVATMQPLVVEIFLDCVSLFEFNDKVLVDDVICSTQKLAFVQSEEGC